MAIASTIMARLQVTINAMRERLGTRRYYPLLANVPGCCHQSLPRTQAPSPANRIAPQADPGLPSVGNPGADLSDRPVGSLHGNASPGMGEAPAPVCQVASVPEEASLIFRTEEPYAVFELERIDGHAMVSLTFA